MSAPSRSSLLSLHLRTALRRRPGVHDGRPALARERRAARKDLPSERTPGMRPRIRRRLGTLALTVLLAVSLLVSVPGLRGVRERIGHLNPAWIVVAVALELASDISFVVLFRLFFDCLSGRDARALAWTEQATGALLPGGGVGGLAIGGWLMHLAGAPTHWIVRRSGGIFFLTSAVNCATVVGAGMALTCGARGPHDFARAGLPALLAIAATLPVAAIPLLTRSRRRLPAWVHGISAGVEDAEQTIFSRHPSWRLAGALGYLGFDMAVLWVALRALGHAPSVPALILAYNIGYLANAMPIPGGIGVLDVGLTGALALYGVAPTHATAAVLVYHAIALWIPGLGGLCAYLRLRPRLLRPGGADSQASSAPSANSQPRRRTMNPAALHLRPVDHGYVVMLTDGRVLAQFAGLGAKRRALRYLASHDVIRDAADVR